MRSKEPQSCRQKREPVTTPHIRTELPGPKARAMIARDVEVALASYPRDYPFVMSHGRGTEVWDVDGNRFLDFAAGIAVCATGHAHPEVVARCRRRPASSCTSRATTGTSA
jgi:4-aminobutyrate aminotransferase